MVFLKRCWKVILEYFDSDISSNLCDYSLYNLIFHQEEIYAVYKGFQEIINDKKV